MTLHVVPQSSAQLRFLTLHDVPDGPIVGMRAEYETEGVTYQADRRLELRGAPTDREKTIWVARMCSEDIRNQVLAHNAAELAKRKQKRKSRAKKIDRSLH